MLSFVFLLALLFLPNALSASPLPSDSSVVAFLQRDYGVKFTDNNRVVFFKNGQLVDKFVGATNKATLEEKFNALL